MTEVLKRDPILAATAVALPQTPLWGEGLGDFARPSAATIKTVVAITEGGVL
jgi:hypothetical protein